jgi:peptide/nickel transport system ATP-binding protein
VRRAITHAVDRQAIVETLWAGRTAIPRGLQLENYGEMYIRDWENPRFDPAEARRLLREAGYRGQPIPYRPAEQLLRQPGLERADRRRDVARRRLNVQIEMRENFSQVTSDARPRIRDWSNTSLFGDPVAGLLRSFGTGTEASATASGRTRSSTASPPPSPPRRTWPAAAPVPPPARDRGAGGPGLSRPAPGGELHRQAARHRLARFQGMGDGLPRRQPAGGHVTAPLIELRDLRVSFAGQPALRGVDLAIAPGEAVGLVGESGCGKSVTWLAALGLLPGKAEVTGGVRLGGQELLRAPPAVLDNVRGGRIAMIFQDPASSLNPVHRIGRQVREALALHRGMSGAAGRAEAKRLLDQVGIPDCGPAARRLPHELSGGQNQRVMIAIALAGRPELLVAEEPTTALDVTIQAQILELLQALRRDLGMALVLISHDLGWWPRPATASPVMYAGRIVEEAPAAGCSTAARHPYTRGLLGALPPIDGPRRRLSAIPAACRSPGRCRPAAPLRRAARAMSPPATPPCRTPRRSAPGPRRGLHPRERHAGAGREPSGMRPDAALLTAKDLVRSYQTRRGLMGRTVDVRAVVGVSLTVERGRTLGLVGESGCGKSTTGRLVLGMEAPDAGSVAFEGRPMPRPGSTEWRALRARMQMVFQDPLGALDRRLPIGTQVAEPLDIHAVGSREERAGRVEELLKAVGLRPTRRRATRMSSRRAAASAPCWRARWRPTRPAGLRRADQRARRLDPGAGDEPAVDLQERFGMGCSSSATTCARCAR